MTQDRSPRLALMHRFSRILLFGVVSWVTAAPHAHAAARRSHIVNVRFAAGTIVPPSIQRISLDEAARIWQPYGVEIKEAADVSMLILIADTNEGSAIGSELGETRFTKDGMPDSSLTVHYEAISRAATEGRPLGLDLSQWPIGLREQIVARALGRVVAHEIGHYVLRWQYHSPSGLMRSPQRASDLIDPSRGAFGLTDVDVARLRAVLTSSGGLRPMN